MRPRALVPLLALLCTCQKASPPAPAARAPRLGPAAITRLIVDEDIIDPGGWGRDVASALDQADQPRTARNVCQVLAIIEQESGYQADPVVPGLGRVVAGELDALFDRLGPAAGPVRAALLDHVGPGGASTFEVRLTRVRTEAEADRLYREIAEFHRSRHPRLAKLMDLVAPDLVEDKNPITTAGSMQVSVRWAIERGADQGLAPGAVRDQLYTRSGGVSYGTARLFETEDYADPVYRFADFNAGAFASRNAALQARVTTLTGIELVRDGDVLSYTPDGRPRRADTNTLRALDAFAAQHAPSLSPSQIRRDARSEKSAVFADTATFKAVNAAFRAQVGREPAPAIVPHVTLESPKFTRELTTRWFAENAERRYTACMQRARQR
jgi:hypothetical protein